MGMASPRRLRRNQNAPPSSSLVIRNIVVDGHRTSVRLEPVMWEALRDIAQQRSMTLRDLVTQIDQERAASSLTAGIRVYIVDFYRAAAFEALTAASSRMASAPPSTDAGG